MATPSGERRGIDGFADDLRKQLVLVRDECPPYTRVLTELLAIVDGPTADAALIAHFDRCWQGRFFNAGYDRPLLVLAALRHDALIEGPRHPLFAAIGATNPDPDAVTRARVVAALAAGRLSIWVALTTRRVQTNEVTRGVVWRWPAFLAGCDGARRPLVLADIGASAGLNLIADRVPMRWTDDLGRSVPVVTRIDCRARIGFDANPIDVRFDDDVVWLRACIWPGDHQRLARFDDAVREMRAAYTDADRAPQMQTSQAWLVPARLDAIVKKLDPDVFVLAYQTFVRAYLEPERQESYARGMRSWLSSLTPGRAAWVECEISPEGSRDPELPSEIVAHVRALSGEIRSVLVARCNYHPRVVKIDAAAAEELRRLVAR